MTLPELDDTATAPVGPRGAPSADGLAAGQQLGHFRVERKLGAGGMGEVYLATDLALDRPVALKVLPAALTHDPTRRDRMIREARAQARISHPHVGHIYFIGEDTGRLYFAMEYVAGVTLAERIAGGPLPPDEALALVRAAALGLREAQRSGFTHRDVKPSNLMVDGHGVVKVLDFGLAAGTPPAAGDAIDPTTPSPQTSLAGTPLYMAPEQGRGEPIDFRADIYALGATLYHLVSGKPPFVAETAGELMSLHASAKRPAVPRGKLARSARSSIDALCTRMMAPDASARFASYDDLIRALENASAEHTRPAGFWVRMIAFVVDFMLVLLLALLLELVFQKITDYESISVNNTLYPMLALLQIVETARRGKTPGKTLFEIEVVALATGEPPARRAAFIRSLVQCGVPLITSLAAAILESVGATRAAHVFDSISVISIPILVVALAVAIASPNKRAIWDRVAGTVVRYRRSSMKTA